MPEAPTAVMPTYGRLPVTFSHGDGAVLYDAEGRPYLDGVSGIAVTNLGHQHPRVTEAITEQAKRLVHTSNLFHIGLQEALADQLRHITGMENMFFCNSGAEANEAGIKLARRYGHAKGIATPQMIVLEGAFTAAHWARFPPLAITKYVKGLARCWKASCTFSRTTCLPSIGWQPSGKISPRSWSSPSWEKAAFGR